jgi:hypothetical protein
MTLHKAALNGDVVKMRRLVAAGAIVDERDAEKEAKDANGRTPLHTAAHNGQLEAIKLLVQLGVNKEAKDAGGMTALHHASNCGRVKGTHRPNREGRDDRGGGGGRVPGYRTIRIHRQLEPPWLGLGLGLGFHHLERGGQRVVADRGGGVCLLPQYELRVLLLQIDPSQSK